MLTSAITREPALAAATPRRQDAALTLTRRMAAGPPWLFSPACVSFLSCDNTGLSLRAGGKVVAPATDELRIRSTLLACFPDPTCTLDVAVLAGDASRDGLNTGSKAVETAGAPQTFEGADVPKTGTPAFHTAISDYLRSACSPRPHRDRRDADGARRRVPSPPAAHPAGVPRCSESCRASGCSASSGWICRP